MPFFIIFVVIPFLEILIFMAVGEQVGLLRTLLLALITAVLGGAIVRYQGLNTLKDIQLALQRGRMPLGELFDGICLIVAGATLITPGFLTDFIGFVLLIPFVRNGLRHVIRQHTHWGFDETDSMYRHPDSSASSSPDDVIEGNYERVDDK